MLQRPPVPSYSRAGVWFFGDVTDRACHGFLGVHGANVRAVPKREPDVEKSDQLALVPEKPDPGPPGPSRNGR